MKKIKIKQHTELMWQNKRIKTPSTIIVKTEIEFNSLLSILKSSGIINIEIEEIELDNKIETYDIEIENYWEENKINPDIEEI